MLTIEEIVKASNGELIQGNLKREVTGFKIDSRECKNGDMYIPLKGEHTDGHNYISSAIDNGCDVILVSDMSYVNEYSNNINIIKVEDTLTALQQIGKYNRQKNINIESIAVTGSVGKTSTREMIASVLSKSYNLMVTEKNMNGHIGLPLMALKLESQDLAVLENGIDFVGEMDILGSITTPEVAVITNIGTSHIGKFGSQDIIYREKTNIAKYLTGKKVLLLNRDDEYLKKYNNEDVNIIYYGLSDAKDIDIQDEKIEFTTIINNKEEKVTINAIGNHNVINAIIAIRVAELYNMSTNKIIEGIASYHNFTRRLEKISFNRITLIDDTYNASPSSTESGLRTINHQKCKRRIAVLADIKELGDYAKEIHTKLGEIFKTLNYDILISYGEDMKYLHNIAVKYVPECYHFENSKQAEEKIREIMHSGDIIYFKGSNVMKVNEIIENIKKDFVE